MGEADKAYSRVQLCKEFGITDRTLRELEGSGQLELSWEAKHGLLRTKLTVANRRLLHGAGNHIHSFGSATQRTRVSRVPFQRFLFLRFLQLPLDDVYDELLEYNLASSRFPKSQLERHYVIFLRNLPDKLRVCVNAGKEPSTKVETQQLRTVLETCEIDIFYDNPERVDGFWLLTHPEEKWTLETLLATTSSLEEIQAAAESMTGMSVNPDQLLFYQQLFSDYSFLNGEELKAHLKRLKPSVRKLLSIGIGSDVDSVMAQLGLHDGEAGTEAMLSTLQLSLMRRVYLNRDASDADSRAMFDRDFKALMLLVDRAEDPKRKPVGQAEAESVFDRFEIREDDVDDNLFEIPKDKGAEDVG